MAIGITLNTALSGMRANAQRVHTAANNIVNQNSKDFRPSDARATSVVNAGALGSGAGVQTQIWVQDDTVNVTREFAKVIAAEIAYKANAQIIRAADEQADELIDIIS